MAIKNFVLDTNILLSDPNIIIDGFQENNIILPLPVIEELDDKKTKQDTIGYYAREVSRQIDFVRHDQTTIVEGVKRNELGALLRIVPIRNEAVALNEQKLQIGKKWISAGFDLTSIDNLIILTALKVKNENPDIETILISNDTNVRIKASIIGIAAEEFKEVKVESKHLAYNGYRTVKKSLDFFGSFGDEGVWKGSELPNTLEITDLDEHVEHNEFILLDVDTTELDASDTISKKDLKKMKSIYRRTGEIMTQRDLKTKGIFGNISGRNLEQSCAIDLLMDDNVKVVSIQGPAGCVDPKTKVRVRIIGKKQTEIIDERKIL